LSAWNVFRLTHPPIPVLLVSFRMLQRIEFFFLGERERKNEINKGWKKEGKKQVITATIMASLKWQHIRAIFLYYCP